LARQPVFNAPGVIVASFALLGLIHGLRDYLISDEADAWVLVTFAFVPCRVTLGLDGDGLAEALGQMSQTGAALFFLGDGQPQWWTLLTYGFLHADWTHLGMNALWLAAFGAPLARRFGSLRFVAFCLVAMAAGAMVHYALHRYDCMPVIGASAAVSGLTAACIRFVFQPHGPLGRSWTAPGDEAYQQPALTLRGVFSDSRALSFLLLWFAVNFIFGAMAQTLGLSQGPVAWEAHAGGFVAGLLLFALFDPPRWREET
jgi:membrane associated rhomboid family serine protease